MALTLEEIEQIAELVSIKVNQQKEWLTKKELMAEFGLKESLLYSLINDKDHPLPYSTFGDRKQLFNRNDINTWLRERMRNAG